MEMAGNAWSGSEMRGQTRIGLKNGGESVFGRGNGEDSTVGGLGGGGLHGWGVKCRGAPALGCNLLAEGLLHGAMQPARSNPYELAATLQPHPPR